MDGPEVRRVREAKGLSASDLASLLLQDRDFRKTGKTVTASMVQKIETGVRQPGPAVFAAIKRVLKVKGDEALLLPLDDSERAA